MARRKFQLPEPIIPPPTPPAPVPMAPLPQLARELVTATQIATLKRLAAALAARKFEALNLYEPLGEQARFHASTTQIRLLRGSNRGGKTLPAAVEVARAVTGQDPAGKYPQTDGRCFCVGKQLDHVGQVMWRKLARPRAFKMVRDELTGQWRNYRPWVPEDAARESQTKPAPALIPRRMIKDIAWENKKEGVPNLVKLTNGWELSFYSSLGKPPQGSDIDLCWFDEEIVDPDWVPEMLARLLDRKGKLVWSATPQAGTEQLYELHERAEKERDEPDRGVDEYVILLRDNPHMADSDKKKLADGLSEEQQRVRIGGDFLLLSYRVYPEYSNLVHGYDAPELMPDWTYYAYVDPGHQVCAVLFGAVSPPGYKDGEMVLLYDELYLKDASAVMFGEKMASKCQGRTFQAFLIDPHGAAITDMGYGKSVGQQYGEQLRVNKVASVQTGHGFRYSADDKKAGIMAVHSLLVVRRDGTPRLRVARGRLPNFEYEIARYHRLRNPDGTVSERTNDRKHNHLMDDLRYLALHDPRWVKPPAAKYNPTGAVAAFRAKLQRRKESGGGSRIVLGPRGSTGGE